MSQAVKGSNIVAFLSRFAILLAVSLFVGFGGSMSGILDPKQSVACGVFIGIIIGTLFFWNFRLALAFIGLAILILTKSLDIEGFVQSSSLEVILFLVGMMVIVGALRDLGFFTWIVQLIVEMPNLTGMKFIAVTSIAASLLACAVDEVTSIIFISTLIFQVCDRLKLNPTPYIIISVLATNIGSSGTMMGNPVGIYIGSKGGLTFGDFMLWAFPLMLVSLLSVVAVLLLLYRKELKKFDVSLKNRLEQGLSLAPRIDVPYLPGLILLLCTVCCIASHHPLETALELPKNSVLYMAPLVCSGIVMIIKQNRARHYVEKEVDWWTLLFFMILFAVAGTLAHTGVDKVMATSFAKVAGTTPASLIPFIFISSAVGSAFVDNVIFVAAFCPVIEQLSHSVKDFPLWWALLFGACFGGNITMIGSTANIVALGMLEKRPSASHVTFLSWLKIGFPVTCVSGAIVIGSLLLIEPLMADRVADINFSYLSSNSTCVFDNKAVALPVTSVKAIEASAVPAGIAAAAKEGCTWAIANGNEGQKVYLAVPADKELPNAATIVNAKATSVDCDFDYPVLLVVDDFKQPKK